MCDFFRVRIFIEIDEVLNFLMLWNAKGSWNVAGLDSFFGKIDRADLIENGKWIVMGLYHEI